MSTPPRGVLSSLCSLADNFLSAVQERVELASLELQEEKLRLIQTFSWIVAVNFVVAMALTFTSLTLVYAFWESARLVVLGGLALFYTLSAGWIIFAFRRYLARQPRPFATSIAELREDRSCIPAEN